jgi:uncharacterized iron-regulated membrane protein
MSDDGTRIFGLICLSTLDGSVLHLAPEKQWSLPQSIRLAALSVHTGSLWGLLTKSVAILASSMLLVLSVTGPWMLWMRGPLRDSSRANAPDSPDDRRSWLMTGAIVFFAILLPTVGISILIFLSIQWALDHLRGS